MAHGFTPKLPLADLFRAGGTGAKVRYIGLELDFLWLHILRFLFLYLLGGTLFLFVQML